ncbi:MAG: cysteine desulfurase [Candidatus Kapabacteria bacterium]|nr:cysteine desulfurase [Candidatus Kapabacteria bacterium]
MLDTIVQYPVEQIRSHFPNLSIDIKGKKLRYLDNAATTHKPQSVIDAINSYYKESNSNIHRGVHTLSQKATKLYENTRSVVKEFINANALEEIIFTKGTTEGINLVANSFGKKFLKQGSVILLSQMEHHSNIVPWQLVADQYGAVIKVIPMFESGELDMDAFSRLITENVSILSIVHMSNSLGTINPVKEMIELAHKEGAMVLVDAAQSAQHLQIDVQELDCDFLVFSGHKLYGPTGVGVLYGKKNILNELPPFMGGGDMILSVTFEKTTFNKLPAKFEAGTPNISGVIGLGSALTYMNSIGIDAIQEYEKSLLIECTNQLQDIPELQIIGTAKEKASVISFTIKNIHPHDVGSLLDADGIAVRAGHHCSQPVMNFYGIPATSRISFGMYNTIEEIDDTVKSIRSIIKMFA